MVSVGSVVVFFAVNLEITTTEPTENTERLVNQDISEEVDDSLFVLRLMSIVYWGQASY